MTADVYAGDDDLNRAKPAVAGPAPTIIRLRADADPDVLFRIAAQLNLLNCAPVRFILAQGAEDDVQVEVHIVGCSEASIDLVCRKLDRLTCVYEVERENAP
jgi:hypothetical protein